MLCMKHAFNAMLYAVGGAIVNISSNSSLRGQANNAPYAEAKSGVNTLTQSGAAVYSGKRVSIKAVSTGVIRTTGQDKLFAIHTSLNVLTSRDAIIGML